MLFSFENDNSSIEIERRRKRFKTVKEHESKRAGLRIVDCMPWHVQKTKIGRSKNATACVEDKNRQC